MKIGIDDLQAYESLKNHVLSQGCVAFVGSGPSTTYYGSWQSLVNRLAQECGCQVSAKNGAPPEELLSVAEQARLSNIGRYHQYLGEHFGVVTDTNPLYGVLMQLPFKCFVTVNLDSLLVREGRNCNLAQHKAYPALDRADVNVKRVIHLHGLVAEGDTPLPNTIVLSKSEFKDAYETDGCARNFLVSTIANDSICFIGCRLQEPVMKPLLEMCQAHQQKRIELDRQRGGNTSPPKRMILLPHAHSDIDGNVDAESMDVDVKRLQSEEDEYYSSFDITPIRYYAAGSKHVGLRHTFEQIADLKKIESNFGW